MNPVKAKEPSFEMLTPAAYAKLDTKSQSAYMNKIRKSWVEFEKKYPLPKDKTSLWNLIIETAHADVKACIIGGSTLAAVRTSNGRYLCPTTGKGCEGQADGFRCGAVFGEACISRLPISSISERCYRNSAPVVDKNNYEYTLNNMSTDLEIICSGQMASSDGCKFLGRKLTEATNEMKIKIAALDRYNQANPATPVAATTAPSSGESNPDFVNVETPAPSAVARDRREVAAASASACTSGSRRQRQAVAPAFDLISGNTCIFQDNKRIIDALTSRGCSGRQITGNLISTEISSVDGSRLYGQANRFPTIITNAEVIERKSATEATFSVRMFKYDISVDPPKLQQISAKIQQKDGQFTFFNAYGIPQKIKIQNNTRDSVTLSNISGFKPLMSSMFRMADDCLLTEDLVALQPSGGNNSGASGAAGSR